MKLLKIIFLLIHNLWLDFTACLLNTTWTDFTRSVLGLVLVHFLIFQQLKNNFSHNYVFFVEETRFEPNYVCEATVWSHPIVGNKGKLRWIWVKLLQGFICLDVVFLRMHICELSNRQPVWAKFQTWFIPPLWSCIGALLIY